MSHESTSLLKKILGIGSTVAVGIGSTILSSQAQPVDVNRVNVQQEALRDFQGARPIAEASSPLTVQDYQRMGLKSVDPGYVDLKMPSPYGNLRGVRVFRLTEHEITGRPLGTYQYIIGFRSGMRQGDLIYDTFSDGWEASIFDPVTGAVTYAKVEGAPWGRPGPGYGLR